MIKQLTTKMRFIALLAAFSISMGTVMAQTEFYQIEDNILVIEFTTPYHYKGGNLLIGIYEIAKGKSQSSVSFAGQKVTKGASITGASYSGVNDITKPTEVSDFIPMVRFIYTLSPREITASVNLKEGGSV